MKIYNELKKITNCIDADTGEIVYSITEQKDIEQAVANIIADFKINDITIPNIKEDILSNDNLLTHRG